MKIGVSSYSFAKYMKSTDCDYVKICDIAKEMGFETLEFQSLEGVVEAIGLDKCKLCTYCWTGEE